MSAASVVTTPVAGLTDAQAAQRLADHGANVLPRPATPAAWRRLLEQLVHFFALMLWAAAVLAFVAGLPELSVAIALVVVVNAIFAFVEEHRADRAAEGLRDLLPQRVTVIRGGRHLDIDAADLVPDDAVLLTSGDRVCADLRTVRVHALTVDTSTLTGESVPAHVDDDDPVFAGTFVTEGEGVAVVTATGSDTRLAQIATLTQAGRRPPSPLTRELHRVVRTIAAIALGLGAVFFFASVMVGTHVSEAVVFAIGVTVALVPEGLLPTVTLSLAIGAQRMARHHALVRRLDSVETLGSTTFVCTDKTGTLTRNEMQAVEIWTPAGRVHVAGTGYEPTANVDVEHPRATAAVRELATVGVRCSTGHAVLRDGRWCAQGDPMEAALDALASRVGVSDDARRALPTRRFPFDPRRRRMSVVVDDELLVKGAPDAVLPRCRGQHRAKDALAEFVRLGLRVLAVARSDWQEVGAPDADTAERNLELLGLVGFEDPPRPEAATAVAACRTAGLKVVMVTGDHPATALAIARKVGLARAGAPVLTGEELPDDDQHLGALVDHDGAVLARVAPEDKLRIATSLQTRGHVVAMTGDGVNDGPALHAADIGVAMGRSGTDVAREAADLVLLDDNFATIVVAIEHGRSTFSNIRRFLTYHLSDNVAELTPFVVWALSGGRFPLALSVLQVLALDIGTDTLSAVALGAEPPGRRTLESAPAQGRLLDGLVARRAFGVLGPIEAAFGILAFIATMLIAGWRPGDVFPGGATLAAASGATFATVVLGQTANAFACRSTRVWAGRLGWLSNRLLIGAALIELAITAGFLFVAPVARVLGHAPPMAAGWTVALLSVPMVLIADLLEKRVRMRHAETADGRPGEAT